MGNECVSVVMWKSRLRWSGHVERTGYGNWVTVPPGGEMIELQMMIRQNMN